MSTIDLDATFLHSLNDIDWQLFALAGEEPADAILELPVACDAPEAGAALEEWVISPSAADAPCSIEDLDREQLAARVFAPAF